MESSLLEGLIHAEVRDLKAQRVHSNEPVRHGVAQDEVDLEHVGFAAAAPAVCRA